MPGTEQDIYFDNFFDDASKALFDNLSGVDNAVLLCMLDDIVQVLSVENNAEWARNTKAHKAFRQIKNEITKRIGGVTEQ